MHIPGVQVNEYSRWTGKCIFPVDDDMMNDSNDFLELSSTQTNFVASSSVLIGGSRRRVAKIMIFKMSWLRNNYSGPLERIIGEHPGLRVSRIPRAFGVVS